MNLTGVILAAAAAAAASCLFSSFNIFLRCCDFFFLGFWTLRHLVTNSRAEPSAECCAGPLGGPFSVCPLHWLFVVYIHGRIGERDTVTSWKWGEKKARNLLVGPFFFPLLYALSISGKSPSFYLYTTPVIGLGPSAIAPSYKIKGTRRAGGKERWMAIACVQAKDKETTGLERESGHMSTI